MRKDCGTCHFEKNLLEEEPCNRCDDNNSEWKSGKIYFAISELESLKIKINEQIDFNESCCERTDLYEAIGIINRRIAELKGENK